jgi:hypothetical protein
VLGRTGWWRSIPPPSGRHRHHRCAPKPPLPGSTMHHTTTDHKLTRAWKALERAQNSVCSCRHTSTDRRLLPRQPRPRSTAPPSCRDHTPTPQARKMAPKGKDTVAALCLAVPPIGSEERALLVAWQHQCYWRVLGTPLICPEWYLLLVLVLLPKRVGALVAVDSHLPLHRVELRP